MAYFSEICRICLCDNVRMYVLKKTGLEKLYKTLTNSFMDEDEESIIICFTCHARLIRCRTLQQQAIKSNTILEQLLAGGSMSIPNHHEARDKIQFTPISHIDIRPVECDVENDCKNEMFSLESVKVEEENFEIENSTFVENGNHEIESAEKQDVEIDAFEDRHMDSENDLPLIAFGSKSKKEDNDKGKLTYVKKHVSKNKKKSPPIPLASCSCTFYLLYFPLITKYIVLEITSYSIRFKK
ncbi:unnamed protein product [Parnassius mnemosyne]|uniref:ZAD domain-containing protein n=1 Tax=Parnassius mnemosyne TaxID=213953 RepID=A0AAV1LC94_9NEOP